MTRLITVVLAAIKLNNFDFLVASMTYHFRRNAAAFNNGSADLNISAFADHQNLVELDGFSGGDFELLELQNFAFLNAVLLTATYYYCVHVVFLPVSLLAV